MKNKFKTFRIWNTQKPKFIFTDNILYNEGDVTKIKSELNVTGFNIKFAGIGISYPKHGDTYNKRIGFNVARAKAQKQALKEFRNYLRVNQVFIDIFTSTLDKVNIMLEDKDYYIPHAK